MTYYVSAEKFAELFPNAASDAYDRFVWDAQKYVDNATMTVDGTKKLQIAFPTDEDDAEAVQRCVSAVINALSEVDAARQAANAASGYVSTENGYRSANIRSVSAGGESITYAADDAIETDVAKAAKSNGELKAYVMTIVESYLRGVQDDNGVNLLFGGCYPVRRWC